MAVNPACVSLLMAVTEKDDPATVPLATAYSSDSSTIRSRRKAGRCPSTVLRLRDRVEIDFPILKRFGFVRFNVT